MDSQPGAPEAEPVIETIQADLSRKAVSLGRYLDRLPAGDYMLILHKQDKSWKVSILVNHELRTMDLYR